MTIFSKYTEASAEQSAAPNHAATPTLGCIGRSAGSGVDRATICFLVYRVLEGVADVHTVIDGKAARHHDVYKRDRVDSHAPCPIDEEQICAR